MKKRYLLLALSMVISNVSFAYAEPAESGSEVTILFTHDIHDYFYPTTAITSDGDLITHGGAARLATLINENKTENSIYVDAGDFAMGTLFQSCYDIDAPELKLLGMLGCEVTTFGNHEFDYGAKGVSNMLNVALKDDSYVLPDIVCANLNFDGELDDDQKLFKDAIDDYGVKDYIIKTVNGVDIAFIGLMGHESISDAPTSGQKWDDYIDTAKKVVKEIGNSADMIVAVSHSGTSGDGKNGEDIELAKKVPEIDVIISGHSHTTYSEPVMVGDTIIVSQGCYLENLGELTVNVKSDGVKLKEYTLHKIDDSVADDPDVAEYVAEIKERVDSDYVNEYGFSFDEVLTHCGFNFTALSNMYKTHEEYPMGDLIADSYMYEARKNGIDDIDVALVGLGTIRSTFAEGDITVADAFESCSLGVGGDGSAGHPIIGVYVTGSELKLMAELDASLGPMVSSIKMSYSGLEYTFNEKRILLDKVTDIHLKRPDGTTEKIENNKLYKVSCNMYAANMLGMLNSLTKGILSISIKDENGNKIDDLYEYALKDKNGREIKEWVAMADYLKSMDEIPDCYKAMQGRKNKESIGGLAIFANPGFTTWVVILVPTIIILVIVYRIVTRKKRKAKKLAKKEAKKAKKALKEAK